MTGGLVLGALVSLPIAAIAEHNWTNHHWHNPPIEVYATTNTGACFQDKVHRATDVVGGNSWNHFTQTPFDYRGESSIHPSSQRIGWDDLDGPGRGAGVTHGFSTFQGTDGHIVISQLHTEIDNAENNWFCGTGDAPDGDLDLWSIISHEIGHWIRLGDLADNSPACPNNSNEATMCKPYAPGTERQRTPNTTEDINSANKAY